MSFLLPPRYFLLVPFVQRLMILSGGAYENAVERDKVAGQTERLAHTFDLTCFGIDTCLHGTEAHGMSRQGHRTVGGVFGSMAVEVDVGLVESEEMLVTDAVSEVGHGGQRLARELG